MFAKQLKNSKLFVSNLLNKRLLSNQSTINSDSLTTNLKRTHYCGSLKLENIGQTVTVCGWLQTVRFSNFIILRDLHGLVQINLDDDFYKLNKSFSVDSLTNESVLSINGVVERRPQGRENKTMKTGFIEIKCKQIEVLNLANKKLPFTISQFNRANETVYYNF